MPDPNPNPDAAAPSRTGVILFAHGARDARWAEPFEQLAAKVAARRAAGPVALAYLELMSPSLEDALARQVAAGCAAVTIVPVFFGQGSHLRRDLPALIEACRQRHPHVAIRAVPAVGEHDAVLDAIASYCLSASAGD
jgi:sirohydrochlorin cobaltochelatase